MPEYLQLFKRIDTVVLDVDGVLTNSQMIITEDGSLLRSMSVRDGYAIKKALIHGIRICVITGGSSKGVESRLKNLGVHHYFSGINNKLEVFEKWAAKHEVDIQKTLYIGDDMPDRQVMMKVGCPACPADAIPEVIEVAKYISPVPGGQGCVRDVIEKVLKLQGNWFTVQSADSPHNLE